MLVVLTGVYYTIGILELALRADVSIASLVKYFVYLSTEIFIQISGIVSVLAISLTISHLDKAKELFICQSSGQSLYKILKPVFFLSIILSLITLFILTYVNPILLKKAKRVYHEEVWKEQIPLLSLSSNKIWYESNNFIFNLQSVDQSGKSGKNLSLYKFSPTWNLDYFIKAKFVDFTSSMSWKLYNGKSYSVDNNNLVLTKTFLDHIISKPPKIKHFNFSIEFYKYMNSLELYKFVKNNKNLGLNTVRYEVEYYSRFLLSFSGLLLIIIFVPFSVGPFISRFKSYKKNTFGVVLSIFYWFIYTGSIKLALGLESVLIIFLPAILFTFLGVFLWKNIKS
ncbi:MAG: YjgP/YjgQ family permease [Bdellovibrionales bacterium]|nr:YjgP/YjgQ family permease [Bdellovibrionales bacterium]